MTNGEWLEMKRTELIQKVWSRVQKHIWVPILILALSIVLVLCLAFLVAKAFLGLVYPLGMVELLLCYAAIEHWSCKEHKENVHD